MFQRNDQFFTLKNPPGRLGIHDDSIRQFDTNSPNDLRITAWDFGDMCRFFIDSFYNAKGSPLLVRIVRKQQRRALSCFLLPPIIAESLLIVLVRGSLPSLVPE